MRRTEEEERIGNRDELCVLGDNCVVIPCPYQLHDWANLNCLGDDVHRSKDLERLDLVTGEFHYLYAAVVEAPLEYVVHEIISSGVNNRGIKFIWVSGGNAVDDGMAAIWE